MKTTFSKTLGVVALAAVLVFGVATITRPSVAQAVTGSSNASLEESHIQILLQIIELLKEQLAMLKGSMAQSTNETMDDSSDDSGLSGDDDEAMDDDDDDNDDEGIDDGDDDDDDDNDDNDADDDDDDDDNDDDNN